MPMGRPGSRRRPPPPGPPGPPHQHPPPPWWPPGRPPPAGPFSRWLGGEAFRSPEPRAPCPRVRGELFLAGYDALGCQETHTRCAATDADGSRGRTHAAPPLGLEETLDDSVFERVVADHDKTATRAEQGKSSREPPVERPQLP